MGTITLFEDAGVKAEIVGDSVKLSGLSRLSPEQKNHIVEYARAHKPAILLALSQTGEPGECESCPASGYWDGRYSGLLCFHTAYYLHKSGNPSPCVEIRASCPRCQNG